MIDNKLISSKAVLAKIIADLDLKEDEIYCHTVNRSDLLFDRYQVENTPTETSVNNKILHIAQWGEDEKIGIIKDLLPLEQDKEIKK